MSDWIADNNKWRAKSIKNKTVVFKKDGNLIELKKIWESATEVEATEKARIYNETVGEPEYRKARLGWFVEDIKRSQKEFVAGFGNTEKFVNLLNSLKSAKQIEEVIKDELI